MTKLLYLKQGDLVLEVGPGSGYQTAILTELTDQVYTVEIIVDLHKRANEGFQRLATPRSRH